MSIGHREVKPIHPSAVALLSRLQLPQRQVSRDYDIPYLGGYSQDGSTIYLDRHLPDSLHGINVLPFIELYESTEKALIDQGLHYETAHTLATIAEHHAVQTQGIDPMVYEQALLPYNRSAEHESVKKVPPNLDLTPYQDNQRDMKALRPKLLSKALKRG